MSIKQRALGLLLCLTLVLLIGCGGKEASDAGPQAHGKQAKAKGGHGKGDRQRPAQPPMPVAEASKGSTAEGWL